MSSPSPVNLSNLIWKNINLFTRTKMSFLFRIVDCFSASLLCNRMPGLSPPQRQMCIEAPDAVSSLAHGQVQAAAECEHQFKGKDEWFRTCLKTNVNFLIPQVTGGIAHEYGGGTRLVTLWSWVSWSRIEIRKGEQQIEQNDTRPKWMSFQLLWRLITSSRMTTRDLIRSRITI